MAILVMRMLTGKHFNLTMYKKLGERVFVRVTLENCLGTRTKEVIPNKKVSFTAFLESKFRSFYFLLYNRLSCARLLQ